MRLTSFTASNAERPAPALTVRQAIAEGLSGGTLALPLLPVVASRVMTMAENPDSDAGDLSDLIHKDQSLASTVLRIANSAAYASGEAIVSLRQAVMRLGTTILGEIAIAACLQSDSMRAPGYERCRKDLLVHAFVTAGFSKELARQKRRNVEALFLCGLLHSIGRPVVLHLLCEVQKDRSARLSELEALQVVGEFQREASTLVTKLWNLPQAVQVVAAHHENADSAPAFVDETRTVALAAKIASWVLENDAQDEASVRGRPEWEPLNYYPDEVEAVLERRAALQDSAAAFMA